jgi:AraC-like DNA-binding protein/quercetin dioxygenase-like cupin family protein
MKRDKLINSLATVKQISSHKVESSYAISEEKLLQNSFNTLKNHYFIHDVQNLNHILPSDEDVYILGHAVTEDFPEHNHDYFELTYVAEGNVLNIIDGNELYMNVGDVSLITPQAVHELRCLNPDTALINICIKPSLLKGTFEKFSKSGSPVSKLLTGRTENKFMFFSIGYSKEVPLYISNMIHEYAGADFHQGFSLEAWLLLLLDFLANCGHYSYTGVDEKTLHILQYIQDNCLELSLENMAKHLGYNPNYLAGYLKRRTGINYSEIVRETRLKAALSMLSETTISIYDISEACGYNSPSHFFKIFKEHFHTTPKKYREYHLRSIHYNS